MNSTTITVRFSYSSKNYTFFVTDHITQEYLLTNKLLIGMYFRIQTTDGNDYDNQIVRLVDYNLYTNTNEKYALINTISDIDTCFWEIRFYIDVTFPKSDKIYRYKIPENEYYKLKETYKIGDKLRLTTNTGGNFQGAEVSLIKMFEGIYDIERRSTIISSIEVIPNKDNLPILTISAGTTSTNTTIKSIIENVNASNQFKIEEKGKKEMKLFGNIEFGKYTHKDIKFSIKGLAYKTDVNKFIAFDPKNQEFTDVSDFILDIDVEQFLYKIPVAISDIAPGDIILNEGHPVFVIAVEGTKIEIISPADKEIKTILAPKNVFGFNYATKLVDLTNGAFGNAVGASEDTPFGNSLLPLMLMTEGNFDNMLPFFLMSNKESFDQNALMMFVAMKDRDALPMILAMNGYFDFFGKKDEKKSN